MLQFLVTINIANFSMNICTYPSQQNSSIKKRILNIPYEYVLSILR